MAIFMLETDALTSASSAISSLASQVNEVSSSINGYDTSCEDGFDFAGAKSVLASNVEACSTKITNTASILENVVSAHTELQSSMKFDGSGNTSDSSSSSSSSSASSSSGATSSGSASSGSSSSGSYSGGGYSGGGYSGGGYSGGGSSYSGGDYSGGYSEAAVGGVAVSDLVAEKVKDSNTDNAKKVTGSDSLKDTKETDKNKETENQKAEEKENKKEKLTDSKSTDSSEEKVKTELKDVNYAYINSDKVTDKSKEIFNDATFNYDTNTGYATVDGKYVIACDSSVGEVGDIIKFSQKDGSTVECVIGTNTVTDASKNVVNFIVDKENWTNKTPMSISENLITNTTNVTNAGQYNVKPNGTITTLVNEISTMDTNTASEAVSAETKEV